MNRRSAVKSAVALSIGAVPGGEPASDLYAHGPLSPEVPPEGWRFPLHNVSIAVDPSEPAFVQHAARERLLQVRPANTTKAECEALITNYLDALLAWNRETDWEKLIDLGVWRAPIYPTDRRLTEALAIVKRVVGEGSTVTRYATIVSFFDSIRAKLLEKYGEDSVMVGCIEPLKLAVIQAP